MSALYAYHTMSEPTGNRRLSFWRRIALAITLHRQRNRLLELEDHHLADIGINRETALLEARKMFWDVPSHWRV
jgi:uncharacterized protein YjiS (DUF1127 family)